MADKLKEIFTLMDADGGGSISIDEVMVFVDSLKSSVTREDVGEMMAEGDQDGNGGIDEVEFVALAKSLEEKTGEDMEVMVDMFCTWCYTDLFSSLTEAGSPTATIRMTELRALIESMEIKALSDEDLRRLFTEHDDDDSGTIDATEFTGIAKSIGHHLPISNIVYGFKQARERSKARMAALKGKFHSAQPLTPTPTPTPTPTASPPAKSCPTCPTLHQQIQTLQAQLDAERTSSAADVEKLRSEKEELADQLEEARKSAAKTKKTKRASRTVQQPITSECEKCLQYEGVDVEALESQIWTLQTALDIRSREGERMRERLMEYAVEVDPLSHSLAERMRRGADGVHQQAVTEAQEVYGGDSISTMLRKKRIVPKTKRETVVVIKEVEHKAEAPAASPARDPRVADLTSKVEVLRGEKNKYKEIGLQWKSRAERMEKEAREAHNRLKKAQEAIVSSAGVGFETDIELQKAKKKMERITRSVSPQQIRSISPMSRSVSPNPQPTYSPSLSPMQFSRVTRGFTSPDVQAQHHMAILRSQSATPSYAAPDLSSAPPGVRATIVSTLNSPSATFTPPPQPPPAYSIRC